MTALWVLPESRVDDNRPTSPHFITRAAVWVAVVAVIVVGSVASVLLAVTALVLFPLASVVSLIRGR